MQISNVIVLAFALAFDAFAVAVAVGIRLGKLENWSVFRLAFHFGFAQFGMPIIGWRAGEFVYRVVGSYGIWVAGAVLFLLGVRLIWEQVAPEERTWKISAINPRSSNMSRTLIVRLHFYISISNPIFLKH